MGYLSNKISALSEIAQELENIFTLPLEVKEMATKLQALQEKFDEQNTVLSEEMGEIRSSFDTIKAEFAKKEAADDAVIEGMIASMDTSIAKIEGLSEAGADAPDEPTPTEEPVVEEPTQEPTVEDGGATDVVNPSDDTATEDAGTTEEPVTDDSEVDSGDTVTEEEDF